LGGRNPRDINRIARISEGYYSNVPDEGYYSNVPDEGYYSNVPDEGYYSNVPDEGYYSNVPDDSMILILNLRTVPSVWYFLCFI
jgi:hypothetical protein